MSHVVQAKLCPTHITFLTHVGIAACGAARTLSGRPSFNENSRSSPARAVSRSSMHEGALPNYKSGAEMSAPTSRRQTGDGERPKIHPMPDNPLSLLKKLTAYIKVRLSPHMLVFT